jgi:hypothetical protein
MRSSLLTKSNLQSSLLAGSRVRFLPTCSYVGKDRAPAQAVDARGNLGAGCVQLPGLFCSVLLVHSQGNLMVLASR